MLFRANSLFRNFEVLGDGDRVLIYLVLFTGDCLERIGKGESRQLYYLRAEGDRKEGGEEV